MWDVGSRTSDNGPVLNIARLRVEFTPLLEPGGRTSVRLAPLGPSQWRHLRPGLVITMREDRSVAGTAIVLEVQRPTGTPAA